MRGLGSRVTFTVCRNTAGETCGVCVDQRLLRAYYRGFFQSSIPQRYVSQTLPSCLCPCQDHPHGPGGFSNGNRYLALRDRFGPLFTDEDFADLYPDRGQPAYPPSRLAVVSILQFMENLSDRRATEAVRARIDWKYLLGLSLDDRSFDASVLCEFRARLLRADASDRVLARLRREGFLKKEAASTLIGPMFSERFAP